MSARDDYPHVAAASSSTWLADLPYLQAEMAAVLDEVDRLSNRLEQAHSMLAAWRQAKGEA